MEPTKKNFNVLRTLDVTSFFLLVVLAIFFYKTIMIVLDAFQSELYLNVTAGLSSL